MELTPDMLVSLTQRLQDIGVAQFSVGDISVTLSPFARTVKGFDTVESPPKAVLGDYTEEDLYGVTLGS